MFSNIKLYVYGAVIVLILALCATVKMQHVENKKIRADNSRLEKNLYNSNFKIKQYTTKSGKQAFAVSALELKVSEFEKLNSGLAQELKDMKIKPKNTSTASEIKYHYETVFDTIPFIKLPGKHLYAFNRADSNIKISAQLNLADTARPLIDSLKVKLWDRLLFAHEIKYKRVWIFWKRPTGLDLHIRSDNKYFQLDTVRTYSFVK